MARGWMLGDLPYRDVPAFNFPGQILAFLAIGICFGWERTRLFYVFDAALFLMFIGLLMLACRRRCGQILPGLVVAVAFSWYYLGLGYPLAAQRDWQGPALAVIGLLTLILWPGRMRSAILSGILLAFACAIRPQSLLFAPAVAVAALGRAPGHGPGPGALASARTGLVLGATALLSALALALPFLIQGLTADFLRGISANTLGGYHNTRSLSTIGRILQSELRQPRYSLLLLGLLVVVVSARPGNRLASLAILLAFLGGLLYRPVSPFPHAYLEHALHVVAALGLAGLLSAMFASTHWPALARYAAIALVLFVSLPSWPESVDLVASVRALPSLVAGTLPEEPPPGVRGLLPMERELRTFNWPDYRATVEHIRVTTGSTTKVAVLIRTHPYPTFTGIAGRAPVFRAESGILWLVWGQGRTESDFIEDLHGATDSVVVRSPGERTNETRLKLTELEAEVDLLYEREARFGVFEVLRRKSLESIVDAP
jgi:hypothetical protein